MRKWNLTALAVLGAFLACARPCLAADKHPTAAPRGGKLLENSAPRAELIIEKDNRVRVIFYDENLKPIPVAGQVVSIFADPKSGRINLALEKKDGAFVSRDPLPRSGFFDEYQITVQIKATASARLESFRVRFDLDVCGKCRLQEYACTCHR